MFGPHVTGPVVSSPAVIGTVLAEGANGFIGHSALIIGFAACLFAALGLVAATTTHNPRLLRAVQSYGWLALVGAVLAAIRALMATTGCGSLCGRRNDPHPASPRRGGVDLSQIEATESAGDF